MTAPAPGLVLAGAAWRRRPVLLSATLVVVLVVVVAVIGADAALPAYLVLGAVGVTLAAVDVATLRLPDVLVGPLTLALLVLLGAAALVDGTPGALGRAVLAGLVSLVAHLALALINPSGLGLGDVKLAAPLGLALGYRGWDALLTGVLAAFLLVALSGLVMLALRRVTRTSELPFGPFMLLGALIGLALGHPASALAL